MDGQMAFWRIGINAIEGDHGMGTLFLDDVDDGIIARLEARAAAHGRSAEAEHREILRHVLAETARDMRFGDLRGKIWMAPDFDETPDDIIDAMEKDTL
jgi:hypothetical protein